MAYSISVIAGLIGYFLIPLIFFVFAILIARNGSIVAWIIWIIGVVAALLALIGNTRWYHLQSNPIPNNLMMNWMVFIALVIITAIIIILLIRKAKNKSNSVDAANTVVADTEPSEIETTDVDSTKAKSIESGSDTVMQARFCRHCGVEIAPDAEFCHRCGTKVVHVEQAE